VIYITREYSWTQFRVQTHLLILRRFRPYSLENLTFYSFQFENLSQLSLYDNTSIEISKSQDDTPYIKCVLHHTGRRFFAAFLFYFF